MNTIDLSPLYRSSIGFDRFGSLLNTALHSDQTYSGYPPYNIEVTGENRYAITLAVAGFVETDLDIHVEKGVLIIQGKKIETDDKHEYLYQGIANRNFERKFMLADYVEVTGANLNNGLLTINLVKEIPEEMKPRRIAINPADNVYELESDNISGREEAA